MASLTDRELAVSTATATIANGASLSGAVDGRGQALVGIAMPSGWTAANLTLQASADGATYNNVYDAAGTEYTITAAASRFIQVPVTSTQGFRSIKVRSGTSGSAVTQGADRDLVLVFRAV